MHRQPGVGRATAQLLADGSCIPKQPIEAVDVERDQPLAVRLDARRKIARERDERFRPQP
jgi:hypothetical protein